MRIRSTLIAVIAVAIFGGVSRADTKEEVAAFLKKLESFSMRLNAGGVEIGKSIGPGLQGGAIDWNKVHKQFRDVAKTVAAVRSEVKAMKIPNSASAKAVHQAYQVFVEHQTDLVLRDLPALFDALDDANATADQRKDKAIKIINDVEAGEKAVGEKLQKAITVLGDEFGIPVR